MDHIQKQKDYHDAAYQGGSRSHVLSADPFTNYVTHWRMRDAFRRLAAAANGRLNWETPILVMCAGEGGEASLLCDMGFKNVTVSDISDLGVAAAVARDNRLKGRVLNAQDADVEDKAYGVVVVQDGLHHLPSPIQGFTEMLRMASIAAVFLEPHDSLAGSLLGTKWEKNGDAINYVFRWRRKLVYDVACSYFGAEKFKNLSYSFWHHNVVFARLGEKFGGGTIGIRVISFLKFVLDASLGRFGNQFCGLVVLSPE